MEAPDRRRPSGEMPDLGAIQTFLNSQRGTAEMLGEWAFYAAVALIAIALIRRIPYKFFAATHTLIAVAYLALVFHAAVLMDFDAWTQPVGIVMALLMIGGVIAAVLALTRQIGRRRRVGGQIVSVLNFPSMKVTEAEITLDAAWPGHDAGQFAFVTFDRKEGKHPFTIASAWNPATRSITVISKGLGDYTELMPDRLTVGDHVTVEGPYGRFTFDDAKDRQIWIGAGIGITPFIARLKHLATAPDGKQVDLIHCVPEIAPEARELLDRDVASAKVGSASDDRQQGRLSDRGAVAGNAPGLGLGQCLVLRPCRFRRGASQGSGRKRPAPRRFPSGIVQHALSGEIAGTCGASPVNSVLKVMK